MINPLLFSLPIYNIIEIKPTNFVSLSYMLPQSHFFWTHVINFSTVALTDVSRDQIAMKRDPLRRQVNVWPKNK